jgi:hypothetical protein
VNEQVGTARIWGDKSIALIGVKIDHSTGSNGHSLSSYSCSATAGGTAIAARLADLNALALMFDPLDFDSSGLI